MKNFKVFGISLLFSSFINADSISNYNNSLLNYEKNIEECKNQSYKEFKDIPPLDVSEEDMRTALSYFIIKTAEDCSEKTRLILKKSINAIQNDLTIAETIRFHSRDILELIKDSDKMISKAKQDFMSLDGKTKKKLKKIEAYQRPFDPTMAIDHYLGHKD